MLLVGFVDSIGFFEEKLDNKMQHFICQLCVKWFSFQVTEC